MHASPRPARTLSTASVLLLILAVTTGWGNAATGPRHGAHATREITGNQIALADQSRADAPGVSSAIHLQEHAPEQVVAQEDAPEPTRIEKAPKPAKVTKPAKVAKPARNDSPPTYAGENRFWIPSLGISNRVHLFECPRQRPPDNHIYRWGCAGTNNVYILGHAYSVMKPLHDAYVRGKLRVGMLAIYANANGKVTRYRVTEWRVVDPVDSHWAIADQPVPSMTLQTCVGKNGRLRLNVRLVAVA